MHINLEKIPKYLILISLNDFYPVVCLHFCFLSEKITKGKKPLWACWNTYCIYGSTVFLDQHGKCLQKQLLFWYILHATYIETNGSTLEKKCCLIRNLAYSLEWNTIRIEYMQIFPAGRQTSTSTSTSWCGVVYSDFLGRSVLCDPRTLNLYHPMFSCNFATLAILDVCVCDTCATKANALWDRCNEPTCFESLL